MTRNIFLIFGITLLVITNACKNRKNVEKEDKHPEVFIPVKVKPIKYTVFKHFIEISGNVEAIDWAFVTPQTNGQVKEIFVNEGDKVKKGQLLLSLDDAIIKNNIADLQVQFELAKINYEKQKKLWEQDIVSEIIYLEAKTKKESLEKKLEILKEQLSYTTIKAPFDGIIENIQIEIGEIAGPNRKLMQIYNLDYLKIKASISEKYVEKIKKGDTVLVYFDNLSIDTLKLPIFRVGNIINPSNRTFDIELRLKNKKHLIKPNMTAKLKINDYLNEKAIVIPINLVKKDFNNEFVFIAVKENDKYYAKKVFVKTNVIYDGMIEIVDALKQGDLLITEGYNEVAGHSLVKILN